MIWKSFQIFILIRNKVLMKNEPDGIISFDTVCNMTLKASGWHQRVLNPWNLGEKPLFIIIRWFSSVFHWEEDCPLGRKKHGLFWNKKLDTKDLQKQRYSTYKHQIKLKMHKQPNIMLPFIVKREKIKNSIKIKPENKLTSSHGNQTVRSTPFFITTNKLI